MTYAHRVDANQAQIMAILRQLGVTVVDLSGVGCGVPDLLCCDLAGTYLVEVKTEDGRVRTTQRRFADSWPGDLYVVRDVGEVINLVAERRNRETDQ